MRIEYSKTADAPYVYFQEVEAARSEDVQEGIVVDFDAQDQLVGIEILDVRSRLSVKDLVNVSTENLPLELVSDSYSVRQYWETVRNGNSTAV